MSQDKPQEPGAEVQNRQNQTLCLSGLFTSLPFRIPNTPPSLASPMAGAALCSLHHSPNQCSSAALADLVRTEHLVGKHVSAPNGAGVGLGMWRQRKNEVCFLPSGNISRSLSHKVML